MKFKVGDVCIVRSCRCYDGEPHYYAGKETTVISVDPIDRDGLFYELDLPCIDAPPWATYQRAWACDNCLELKKPPEADRKREEVGEWELCPWHPERVTAP